MMPEDLPPFVITGVTFAVVHVLLSVGHHVGDHWAQRGIDAVRKQLAGRVGSLHCLVHVATVTVCKLVALVLGLVVLGLPVPVGLVVLGLTVDAMSHYIVDRGRPLRAMADATGNGEYMDRVTVVRTPGGPAEATGPGTAAYELDQSWHRVWLVVAALIMASGAA